MEGPEEAELNGSTEYSDVGMGFVTKTSNGAAIMYNARV